MNEVQKHRKKLEDYLSTKELSQDQLNFFLKTFDLTVDAVYASQTEVWKNLGKEFKHDLDKLK